MTEPAAPSTRDLPENRSERPPSSMREIDEKIARLTNERELFDASARTIREAVPAEKGTVLSYVRDLHKVPHCFHGTEKETVRFIDDAVKRIQSDLHELSVERAALAPRVLSLSDKTIVDLARTDQERWLYRKAIEYRETALVALKRLYFETQGGPTRRRAGRPGDVPMVLEALDGSRSFDMAVHFWKNINAFYEHLSPEDRLRNEGVLQSLLTKMKKALPFFAREEHDNAFLVEAASQGRSLGVGESLVLPGGTIDHAVVFEIKREGVDSYSFRLFNSGGGVERHHGGKGGKYSNVQVRNIPASKLGKAFFSKLYGSYKTPEPSIDFVYQSLRSLGPLEFDKAFRYDQGGIGSCAYQCLLRWAKAELGAKLYRQLHEYTLRSLLDDCACRFGGLVREDGSVRDISALEEVDSSTIAKLTKAAERAIQKVGRSIFIDKAVEMAAAIPDEEKRRSAFLSIIETEGIRATILDSRDRCLVLLKIAEAVFLRGPGFLEELSLIEKQLSEELEKISDPEQRGQIEFEVGRALFMQNREAEAMVHIDKALQRASLIENLAKREGITYAIVKTLILEARTRAAHGEKEASGGYVQRAAEIVRTRLSGKIKTTAIVVICRDFLSLGDVQKARELLEAIPDPGERKRKIFDIRGALLLEGHEARSCGRMDEAEQLLRQAAEMAELLGAQP